MSTTEGFSVDVGDVTLWNGHPVTCPDCGSSRELTMTAFPVDTSTTFRCRNDHVWFRHDIPGKFVEAVHRRLQEDPDAPEILINPEEI
jgi:NAD-dependent SIR2 family protein deacetylase